MCVYFANWIKKKHRIFKLFNFRLSTAITAAIKKDQVDHKTTEITHSTTHPKTDETLKSKSSTTEFKSVLDRMHTTGQNSELFNGPNEDLLL